MPLQIRRGTELERQALTTPLANGEPLWVTNTKLLYIGDGVTPSSMLTSVSSHLGDSVVVGDLIGSVYADDSTLLVDGVGGTLLGTHIGVLHGSVYTTDGLNVVIDGSTGHVSTDTLNCTHAFTTNTQLGTPGVSGAVGVSGTSVIYNTATPFVRMYGTSANSDPKIEFNTTAGFISSPTAVLTDTTLGGFSFNGFVSGATYDTAVSIKAVSDGAIVNSHIPGKLIITTTSADGMTNKTLSFDSSGNLTAPQFTGNLIGNSSTATVGYSIPVYADAAERNSSINPGDLSLGMLAMLVDDGFGNTVTQHYSNDWVTLSGVRFTNSAELAILLPDATGSGFAVFNNNPVLITPTLGAATATSVNKISITTPLTAATLSLADNSTLATIGANTTALTTTGATTLTLPVSGTVLSTDSDLVASKLTGTIPSAVLANSSVFIGTTSIALNRATGVLAVDGLNTTGFSGALKTTTGFVTVSASVAPSLNQVLVATSGTVAEWATPNLASFTGAITMAQASGVVIGRPALLLDFANSKTLDSRITFTRATTATYYAATGLLKTATAGEARFDHDTVTGYPIGLLIEEQRTNLLNHSESFLTAGGTQNNWTNTSITRTSSTNTAPDGTASALQLTATAANATIVSSAVVGSAATRALSVFVKRISGTGAIQFTTDNGVNWTTQTITSSWHRYSFGSTLANQQVGFRVTTSGDSIQLWGVQLENGDFSTSYIKTTTATATRDADNAVITGSNFASWYNPAEGTVVATVDSLYTASTITEQTIIAFNNGTTDNFQRITRVNAASRYYVKNTTVDVDLLGNTFVTGTSAIAVSYNTNDFAYTADGVVAATDMVSLVPSVTALSIGSWLGTNTYLNGHISKLAYFAKRISNTNIALMTAG